MEAFLVKYDDIDGVYAGDDNMGVGALNAAKAAGREGIIFVGATNFAVGYEAMEKGEYWGSIYQSPVDDAKAALKTAIDVLDGEGSAVPQLLRHAEDHPGQHVRISPSRCSEPRGISSPDAASAASGSILLSLPCDRGGEHGPVVWTGPASSPEPRRALAEPLARRSCARAPMSVSPISMVTRSLRSRHRTLPPPRPPEAR
jgi:hypothetical protein